MPTFFAILITSKLSNQYSLDPEYTECSASACNRFIGRLWSTNSSAANKAKEWVRICPLRFLRPGLPACLLKRDVFQYIARKLSTPLPKHLFFHCRAFISTFQAISSTEYQRWFWRSLPSSSLQRQGLQFLSSYSNSKRRSSIWYPYAESFSDEDLAVPTWSAVQISKQYPQRLACRSAP